MKEKGHIMSTEQKIKAILSKKDGEEETISIVINKKEFKIDFSSKDQSKLQDLFLNILNELEKHLLVLEYEKDADYKNAMIESVAQEYINDLNNEIKSCYGEIQRLKEHVPSDADNKSNQKDNNK